MKLQELLEKKRIFAVVYENEKNEIEVEKENFDKDFGKDKVTVYLPTNADEEKIINKIKDYVEKEQNGVKVDLSNKDTLELVLLLTDIEFGMELTDELADNIAKHSSKLLIESAMQITEVLEVVFKDFINRVDRAIKSNNRLKENEKKANEIIEDIKNDNSINQDKKEEIIENYENQFIKHGKKLESKIDKAQNNFNELQAKLLELQEGE